MNNKNILILGDLISLAVLTWIGFATHGETDWSDLPRMAATLIPMLLSWFLLTPWLGLFNESITSRPINILRIPFAMLFTAPLASTLRALWLGTAMLPLFPFILGASNALGMMLWRGFYIFIAHRIKK